MSNQVLITGGSGLIGRCLSAMLISKGYTVAWLSRNAIGQKLPNQVKLYQWHVDKGFLDDDAIIQSDYIIHLAGAGLADKRLTPNRKKVIIDSRVKSTELIINKLKGLHHQVKAFISSSAIGYYPSSSELWFEEDGQAGNTFLSEVCLAWENAVKPIGDLGIRTVINRIGIVLGKHGGALKETERPLLFGVAAVLGNGSQYNSWIHINDLCRMIIHEMENESINGVYNAVSPVPITNKAFTMAIAKAKGKFALPLPTPKFILQIMLGELADVVLESHKISPKKIKDTGFSFNYPKLEDALGEIYG